MKTELFELTIEQQFEMRQIQDSLGQMSAEQMRETLLQASRLLMVKDNVIRSLIKQHLATGGALI